MTNINSKSIQSDASETNLSKLKFSFNENSIYLQSSNKQLSLIGIANRIKAPSLAKKTLITKIRNTAKNMLDGYVSQKEKDRLKDQIDYDKQNIGYYLNGTKTNGSGGQGDYLFNGCIFFDLDFRHRGGDALATAFKNILKSFDFVALSHISTTAYGVKGIFYTDLPSDCTPAQYKFAEEQIFAFIASKGIHIEYDQHGLGKTCYYSFDSDPYLNLDARPFNVDFTNFGKATQSQFAPTATTSDELQGAIEFLIDNKIDLGKGRDETYRYVIWSCCAAFGDDGEGYAYELLSNNEAFLQSSTAKNFSLKYKSFLKSYNPSKTSGDYILKIAKDKGFKFQSHKIEKSEKTINLKGVKGEYLADILQNNSIRFTPEHLNNTIIVAPTGTGKSFWGAKLPFPKIVVCPTNTLCNNYTQDKYQADIFTGKTKEDKALIERSSFIVTTHANLSNLLRIVNPQNYVLFVDEYHNFTTSANKNFMLKDLRNTLELSKQFKARLFVTGTDIYNFHSEFTAMKKIIVEIPKAEKSTKIIECKSVIQTAIEQAKEEVSNGGFPVILLNDKKTGLKQLISQLDGFLVLNSDEKESEYFNELTKKGNINDNIKGIITTSVLKEGNDIYNKFNYKFIICNIGNAIFHSVEIEQMANRAREANSINVAILKHKNRKKVYDTFCAVEAMRSVKSLTVNHINELKNIPPQYLNLEVKASLNNGYAYIEKNGGFELCELLLSNKVFELERRHELSNEDYQKAQLSKYGFVFSDSETNDEKESDELKAIAKQDKEQRKEQKRSDFESTKHEILERLEQSPDFDIESINIHGEGSAFAVRCFKELTLVGIAPGKVFKLCEAEKVEDDNDLKKLSKSIALEQLSNNDDYRGLNTKLGIQIQCVEDSILEGEKYTTKQLRIVMRKVLNLEKGFNSRRFDKTTTNHEVLEFTRLFFDIEINRKTGFYKIKGRKKRLSYFIENENKFFYPNELKINTLCKITAH